MYENNLRPSQIIAKQREIISQLESLVETLQAALAASDLRPIPLRQPWMEGLTPQERALLEALYKNFPNAVSKYDLLDMLPGQDRAEDRQVQLVCVKIHHLRKKLGTDVIKSVWGEGYRLGEQFYEEMRPPAKLAGPRRRLAVCEPTLAA